VIRDGVRRNGRGIKRRGSLPDQVSPQAHCLGSIDAVANAAGTDDESFGTSVTYFGNGFRCRLAPADEGAGDVGLKRRGCPFGLNGRPTRPASAGHIDDGDACIDQTARQTPGNAATNFLDDKRDANAARQLLDGVQKPAPVAIAFRLHSFLQRVQVNDEGIGTHHLHRACCLILPEPEVQLGRTEIGQEGDRGSKFAQVAAEAGIPVRLYRHALGADGESDLQFLACGRQIGVDQFRAFGPTGHGTDEKRGAYMLAQKAGADLDLIHVYFRKRNVLEDKAVKTCTDGGSPPSGKDNVEMIVLTAERQ